MSSYTYVRLDPETPEHTLPGSSRAYVHPKYSLSNYSGKYRQASQTYHTAAKQTGSQANVFKQFGRKAFRLPKIYPPELYQAVGKLPVGSNIPRIIGRAGSIEGAPYVNPLEPTLWDTVVKDPNAPPPPGVDTKMPPRGPDQPRPPGPRNRAPQNPDAPARQFFDDAGPPVPPPQPPPPRVQQNPNNIPVPTVDAPKTSAADVIAGKMLEAENVQIAQAAIKNTSPILQVGGIRLPATGMETSTIAPPIPPPNPLDIGPIALKSPPTKTGMRLKKKSERSKKTLTELAEERMEEMMNSKYMRGY